MVRMNSSSTNEPTQTQQTQQQQPAQPQRPQKQTTQQKSQNKNFNNNNNNNSNSNNNNIINNSNVASTSSSTSSLNSLSSTSLEQNSSSGGIVMVVPQQQQQQQQQQTQQQTQNQTPNNNQQQQQQQQPPQFTHMQHVAQPQPPPQHVMQHHQQQMSPNETGSNPPLPASPPLLQQTPTPPQGAQLVPCAVHHPQQHQQQMALVAAMQAHMAATGGGPMPPPHLHHHHHGPPPQQPQQPTPAMENGHGGLSPSGSTTSSVSSNSGSGGSSNMGNGNVVATAAAPPPPPPGPGPVYIQYHHGEFYPAEYYIAPHPHEGICPQHPHHHQPMCAIPGEYGPTTVQMVSQNRPPPPPMPVPVQVPQGQVMQPYVNESGTLTHVVLSPQQYQQLHAGQGHMHPPFLTTNGTSHFYTPIPGGFPPPGAGGQGPGPYQVGPHGHMAPPPQPGTPQPQQQPSGSVANSSQQQHSPASHSANHSPSPPNNSYHKDERTQRQHTKLLRKLDKQRSAVSSPTHSPSPRRQEPQMNGHNTNNNGSLRSQHNNNIHHQQQRKQHSNLQQQQRNGNVSNYNNSNRQGSSSVASSEEGEDNFSSPVNGDGTANNDEEEDYQASIVDQLSTIQKPEVTDITSRSAKIVWEAPPCISESALQLIKTQELRYNVLLSDRATEGTYKSLYKGSSYDCIVQDLKPGQEYVVRLQVHYEHLHGTPSEPTEFTTPACEPDRPAAPRMVLCTKNSLHLRWNNPPSNGAPIQHYLLEYDGGKTGARVVNEAACKFVEAVKTKGKQYIMTKLQPSTIYNFRLAAVNEVGPSAYSPICTFSTLGNPPAAPKPPTLQAFNSSSLRLVWERRQSDGATCIYVLQMLDRASGHGYLNMYNGQDCSYECCQLRRATLYSFRLRAENEAGASAWSNEVAYKTAPERPGRPGKPYAKGKIHGTHFRVRWEPPSDNGGADIQRYYLEINAGGQKFDRIYTGVECEATCDRLQPGTTYQLRASCEGPGGISPYSEVSHITSEAVVPAAPPSPYYDNPPGPYAAVLRLDKPEYNGGAPILEFELQLRKSSDQDSTPRIVYRGKDAYCVIKDLQPGNQYEVQVRAINRIGAGAWSPWFKFSSAAAPPNNPESLKVIIKSATQLHVSWQEPANKGGAPIAEYRLESATASNVANESDADSTPQPPPSSAFHACYQGLQTSADIRNLMPFTYYYFRVNACNIAGVSKWSPLVNCQTPAAVPAAPQIKDFEFTSNEATLRWSAPECNGSEIINYSIEYAERTITTSDNATEYTVTNLHPETSYKFRVQAINGIGFGPYSQYAKLTTLPSPPSPPKLECSGVGHNFIKLKWGDGKNLDFTKFYVEMFVQRAKEFQVVYSGTNCMCKVNKLQERTAYTFRICAGNDRAGVGEYSEEFVFSTSACLPSSIKAPRIAQNLPTAAGSASSSSASGNNGSSPSTASSSAGVIPSGLLPETPSFLTGLGNLMLGVPLTLEWQHSKNSFSDRVEYMLQYAIGKDGEFKKIYRGSETKFTIENLEPGGLYQFRVCPIRVTNNGEDLMGAFTSAFRHQVPIIPSLDDIDGNLLNNAAAQMFAGLNAASGNSTGHAPGSCHGHSHHHAHHSHMGGHSHHHNPLHSHHNSRHSGHHNNGTAGGSGSNDSNSNTNLHHRSVSASATSSSSSSNSSSSKNSNTNANNTPSNNTLLIGSNAIGFIPIGSMASELAASFAGCDDPNHHHHHHHHGFPDVANQLNAAAGSSGSSNSSNNPQSAASLLAASANQLFANNPILLQAATAAISHHQHVLGHHHGAGAHNQNAGALRRFVTKLSSVYSNRKRFSDQEKAVIFMVSFLFFTFLFATLVKMFMR